MRWRCSRRRAPGRGDLWRAGLALGLGQRHPGAGLCARRRYRRAAAVAGARAAGSTPGEAGRGAAGGAGWALAVGAWLAGAAAAGEVVALLPHAACAHARTALKTDLVGGGPSGEAYRAAKGHITARYWSRHATWKVACALSGKVTVTASPYTGCVHQAQGRTRSRCRHRGRVAFAILRPVLSAGYWGFGATVRQPPGHCWT